MWKHFSSRCLWCYWLHKSYKGRDSRMTIASSALWELEKIQLLQSWTAERALGGGEEEEEIKMEMNKETNRKLLQRWGERYLNRVKSRQYCCFKDQACAQHTLWNPKGEDKCHTPKELGSQPQSEQCLFPSLQDNHWWTEHTKLDLSLVHQLQAGIRSPP